MTAQAGRVLIERGRIADRVRELGAKLTNDLRIDAAPHDTPGGPLGDAAYSEDEVVLIPVMLGAIVFAADLIRAMPLRMSIKPLVASSYAGATTRSSGMVHTGDIPEGLEGRHVVIVDDILDTGRTLAVIRDRVLEQNPASLRICVLLRKLKPRDAEVEAHYAGFDIPDEFVVGYGLDYDGLMRNLPDIVVLDGAGE
ncbi:MAG: hypoxanthine phosphoribosyltransferase [Phycisphaerales bacterium]|nr:MAG: hypoxanthine phosphoribosyltransferase [Phycisphaerales bacterium]